MKTKKQVDEAINKVIKLIQTPGISDPQKKVLSGMSVALNWVIDDMDGGSTLQHLMDGKQMAIQCNH